MINDQGSTLTSTSSTVKSILLSEMQRSTESRFIGLRTNIVSKTTSTLLFCSVVAYLDYICSMFSTGPPWKHRKIYDESVKRALFFVLASVNITRIHHGNLRMYKDLDAFCTVSLILKHWSLSLQQKLSHLRATIINNREADDSVYGKYSHSMWAKLCCHRRDFLVFFKILSIWNK